MFLITFHGGSKGTSHIYSYNDDGSGGTHYLKEATPKGPNGFRDIQFLPFNSEGQFYLVNSYKKASEIFQIQPGATLVPAPLVNGEGGGGTVLCSVYHPFAMAFDSVLLQVCYISNQDSNVVVRVKGPNDTNPGQAMSINPCLLKLSENPTFLPGAFVASQVPLTPPESGCNTPTAVTSEQGGLAASFSNSNAGQTPSHSVRGIALIGTTLYVADEADNCIRTYNTNTEDTNFGAYLNPISDTQKLISSPTHLLVNNGLLYICVGLAGNKHSLSCFYPPLFNIL